MPGIKVAFIGGSGLAEVLGATGVRHEVDTPFGKPSDAIIETVWSGLSVLVLARHGAGHVLSPSQIPYRANIFALKKLGCTHIVASGAVGSLRDEFKPRELVIPDQIIDKTQRRAGTFYENAAVHVEFAEPFCPVLRQILMEAAVGADFKVHGRGCYVCMEGPAFSTRAESLMRRLWGGDLIGMTAMPEAKLAREAEIAYALVALVTDYDSWRNKPKDGPEPALLLKEIMENLRTASDNALALLRRAAELLAARQEELTSPAARALEHAIWTARERIPAGEVSRLAPLWGKYWAPKERA